MPSTSATGRPGRTSAACGTTRPAAAFAAFLDAARGVGFAEQPAPPHAIHTTLRHTDTPGTDQGDDRDG